MSARRELTEETRYHRQKQTKHKEELLESQGVLSAYFSYLFVFLVGKDRQLCSVDLKQLASRARQVNSAVPLTALSSQGIEKITNCHLFAVGQVRVKHSGVCINNVLNDLQG